MSAKVYPWRCMIPESSGLGEVQAFHAWLDEQKGFKDTLMSSMVWLTAEVGEVAQAIERIEWA